MGLFNKHKLSDNEQQLMDKLVVMLFGSYEKMREQLFELNQLLNKKYSPQEISNILVWMMSCFTQSGEKSSLALVDKGQMLRHGNKFSRDEAMIVYNYVVKAMIRKQYPDAPESMYSILSETLGNSESVAMTDVISGATGEYGYCATNPIPVCGIPANEVYLKKLALFSDERFIWKRIGSTGADNIEKPIDMYQILSTSGERLCVIYISPYQKVTSNTPPKGFYIKK